MDPRYTITVTSNFILNVMWLLFMVSTLEPRYSKRKTWLLLLSFIILMFTVSFTTAFDQFALRFLIVIGLETLFAIFIFKDKWPRILLTILLMYITMVLSELLFSSFFPKAAESRDWLLSLPKLTQINIFAFYLSMNGVLLLITALFLRRRSSMISLKEWLVISLFPLSQMVVLLVIFYLQTVGVRGILAYIMPFVVLVCLLADIALFWTLSHMERQMALRLENQRLDRQIEAQKRYYAALSAQYESIRFLQHDIANHVHTIQLLLENNQTEEASAYAREILTRQGYRSGLGVCDNPIVDAFLFSSIETASANGIEVRSEVCVPTEIGIANADLISAFGNLMDNAVEACMQVKGVRPLIQVKAAMRPPYLFIEMVNPVPETAEHKRKSPWAARGMGTQILSNMARQYDGEYITEIKDGCYHARLTLDTGTKDPLEAECPPVLEQPNC